MTPELREKLAEIRQRIGTSAQKGFNYHTAHLWVAFAAAFCASSWEKPQAIILRMPPCLI